MKIIDAHTHIFDVLAGFGSCGELRPIGNGVARWATGEEMAMIPPELGDRCFPAQTLASLLRDQGVEKAVLLQGGLCRCQSISGFVHPQRNLRSLLRPGRRSG